LTLAYSKEENAIVERANREVNRHLRDIIHDSRVYDTWSFAYIPLIMRIINSEVHSSTGCTPAQLLFGNAVNLQRELFQNISADSATQVGHDYLRDLVKEQALLLQVAAEKQRSTDLYNLKVRSAKSVESDVSEIIPNSFVLWNDPASNTSKLEYPWKGPFLVKKRVVDVVTLECLIDHTVWDVHVNRVRPYFYDSQYQFPTPVQMAARDKNEFFVELISMHRLVEANADVRKTSSYEFLVRWVGFPNQDSWEPYSSLCNNQHLHDYVFKNATLKPIHSRVRSHLRRMQNKEEKGK
jgi:hypothetical protein